MRHAALLSNGENDGGRPWIGTVEHRTAGVGPVEAAWVSLSSSVVVTVAVTLPSTPSPRIRTAQSAAGSHSGPFCIPDTAASSSSIPTSPSFIVSPAIHTTGSQVHALALGRRDRRFSEVANLKWSTSLVPTYPLALLPYRAHLHVVLFAERVCWELGKAGPLHLSQAARRPSG